MKRASLIDQSEGLGIGAAYKFVGREGAADSATARQELCPELRVLCPAHILPTHSPPPIHTSRRACARAPSHTPVRPPLPLLYAFV